jgi:hypothetical protein
LLAGYDLNKEFMDAPVNGQFRMKSCRHQFSLPNQNWGTITGGQGLNFGASRYDARSADEDHLKWAAGKFGFSGQDCRIDLPAVCVALYDRIQNAEAPLRRVANLTR